MKTKKISDLIKYKNRLNPKQSKWLKALESGSYGQGHGRLRWEEAGKASRYCCLGVYCEINNKFTRLNSGQYEVGLEAFVLDAEAVIELCLFNTGGEFRDGYCVSTPESSEGISLVGGAEVIYLVGGTEVASLIGVNDTLKLKFKALAKLIRSDPWLVFKNFSVKKIKHPMIVKRPKTDVETKD